MEKTSTAFAQRMLAAFVGLAMVLGLAAAVTAPQASAATDTLVVPSDETYIGEVDNGFESHSVYYFDSDKFFSCVDLSAFTDGLSENYTRVDTLDGKSHVLNPAKFAVHPFAADPAKIEELYGTYHTTRGVELDSIAGNTYIFRVNDSDAHITKIVIVTMPKLVVPADVPSIGTLDNDFEIHSVYCMVANDDCGCVDLSAWCNKENGFEVRAFDYAPTRYPDEVPTASCTATVEQITNEFGKFEASRGSGFNAMPEPSSAYMLVNDESREIKILILATEEAVAAVSERGLGANASPLAIGGGVVVVLVVVAAGLLVFRKRKAQA